MRWRTLGKEDIEHAGLGKLDLSVCALVEIVRWVVASFGPLKAGLDPPLRGSYRQLLVGGLIDRRRNDVACGLDHLGWSISIALNGVKKVTT